jgi:hypothetical protein
MLSWHGNLLLAQDFSNVYKAKLQKPEQYKLLKAETFKDKGNAFVSKAGYFSQSQIADSVFSTNNEKLIEAYFENSIKASFCFKTANGLLYEVLDKNLKEFWALAGNKNNFQEVKKIERAAYDSLFKADRLREMAEKEIYVSSKIPLVTQAETIENDALCILEKVLFCYMNWPQQPNVEWLLSTDRSIPKTLAANQNIISSGNVPTKDTTQKAANIYSLMRISENQIDTFNEFLHKKYPGQAEKYLIDFQGLYESVIDSLHIEWHKYLYSGKVAPDTIKPVIKTDTIQVNKNRVDTVSYIYLPFNKIRSTTNNKLFHKETIGISGVRINTLKLPNDIRSKEKDISNYEQQCLKSHFAGVVRRLRRAHRFEHQLEALSVVRDYAYFIVF